jgi:shikimate dehydrogenase
MNYLGGLTHLYLHIKDPHDVRGMAAVADPIFEEKGLDACLVPVHVRMGDLEELLPRLAGLGNVKGFLISMPFKEAVVALCDELGPHARLVGSVNTVRIAEGGRLAGEIFDGLGLVAAAYTNGIPCRRRRMLLLGAGGAARAIAFAAVADGLAAIEIWNRTPERAERLVADLRKSFPQCEAMTSNGRGSGADLVVSCVPGLASSHLPPADPDWLRATTDIIDIVPAGETALLKRARAKGCKAIDGRPMILHQLDLILDFMCRPPRLA